MDPQSPELDLAGLSCKGFDPLPWLERHLAASSHLARDVDGLRWALQQAEVQKAAEFETKAHRLKPFVSRLHKDWSDYLASDAASSPGTLQGRLHTVSSRVHQQLSSSDMATLNRLMCLERTRASCLRMQRLLGLEAEWRRMRGAFNEAMEGHDLDTAQAQLQAMDGAVEEVRSEAKGRELEGMRQRFVAIIRSM
jgi:hypothetical protein